MSLASATGAASRHRVKPGIYRRTNGDGSVTYEIVFRGSDGRQRLEKVGPRLREAEARLAQVKADMSRGARVAPSRNLTVSIAAETWYASTGHLRATTRAAYRHSLDTHVLPAFGHRGLDQVTPDDLARWIQRARTLTYRIEADQRSYPDAPGAAERRRPTTPYRAATISLALRTLGRVYGHAIRRQGFAGTSPVAALERAERPSDEPKRQVILTPAQLAAVVEAALPAHRPVIAFLAGTGCRLGEALGVTWANLDLTSRTVRIEMQLNREDRRVPLKTGHGRRTLELPGSLVALLAEHQRAAAPSSGDDLVFASSPGYRSIARCLPTACKRAGVPVVSAHALRHAHASALLADGWDLAAVSRHLGHGSVAITASTYAHLLDDAERRRARHNSLDRLYGGGA